MSTLNFIWTVIMKQVGFLFLEFPPSSSTDNKGNWELREKRKTNKQFSDLFGTPFKVEGIMQR